MIIIKEFWLKNKIPVIVSLIFLFGLFLRIIYLNEPNGYWYDEELTYSISKSSFPFGIMHRLLTEDYHAPLYYFMLHFWLKLFDGNDFLVRFSSVLPGIFLISVGYLIGKEISSQKTGIIISFLISINSFLIYYSHELRFYSLVSFLGALSLLFLIKIAKNPDKKYLAGLIFSNLAILYSFTISAGFIFFEAVIFFIYLHFRNKKAIKPYIYVQIITFAFYIPYLSILIHNLAASSTGIISPFWFKSFDYVRIPFIIQDWFSPILVSFANFSPDYYNYAFMNISSAFAVLFIVLIPVFIHLFGIIKAISKKNIVGIFILIGFIYFIVEIIAAANGKLMLISKYTILSFIFIFIGSIYGLASLKNRKISTALISYLVIVNLYYLASNPFSAPRIPRIHTVRNLAAVLNKYSLNSNDVIIMPLYGKLLNLEYPIKSKFVSLNLQDAYLFRKENILKKVVDSNIIDSATQKNAYEVFRSYIGSDKISPPLENYIKRDVFDRLEKKSRVVLVITRAIGRYNQEDLTAIVNDDKQYKSISPFFMLYSKASNDLEKISQKYLKLVYKERKDFWEVEVFLKP